MKSFLSKLFGTKASRPASIGRQARLNVEALEERSLMSAAPISPTLLAVTTQPPASVTTGSSFALVVKAEDKLGDVASTYNGNVTLALLTNPGGSVLSGVLTEKALNGVASFSGLSLNKAGMGYELKATSGTLTSAPTSGFKEVAAPTKVAASVVAKTPPVATPSGNVTPPIVIVKAPAVTTPGTATPPIVIAKAPVTTTTGKVIPPIEKAAPPKTPAAGTAAPMDEVDGGYDDGDGSYYVDVNDPLLFNGGYYNVDYTNPDGSITTQGYDMNTYPSLPQPTTYVPPNFNAWENPALGFSILGGMAGAGLVGAGLMAGGEFAAPYVLPALESMVYSGAYAGYQAYQSPASQFVLGMGPFTGSGYSSYSPWSAMASGFGQVYGGISQNYGFYNPWSYIYGE